MSLIRIGKCTLDCSDGTVVSAAGATRLEPKVLAVLLLLIDRRGAVVPKEVLLHEIWGDTHVAPGALARTISILRRALGDDARGPGYIETIPKRGYRLIATIEAIATRTPPPVAHPHRLRLIALAAIVAASVVMTGPWLRMPVSPKAQETALPKLSNQTRADNENAFAFYSGAVATNPSSAEAYAGLSLSYAFRANYLPNRPRWAADAIEAASRAAELDPMSVSAVRALAIAHAQAGRLRQAAIHYRRALDLCPEDAPTRTNLGIILMAGGHVADAVALFEEHVAADSALPDAYAYLANGLVVAGYTTEAIAVARRALTLAPYALEPQLLLVRTALLQEQYDSARVRLERLLEVWPDCSSCVTQLGLIDQLTGTNQRAEARFLQARAMSPSPPLASLRLAQLWLATGRSDDATSILKSVEAEALAEIDTGSEAPMLRWRLAAAAAVRGDRALARRWYGLAVEAGRRDAAWDQWEPLLVMLRSSPEFVALRHRSDAEHRAAASAVFRSEPINAALGKYQAAEITDMPGWPVSTGIHRR